jgi:hypothetical protein
MDGSTESGRLFCVGAFKRNMALLEINMFPHLFHKDILYILNFQCDLQR